MKLFIVTFALAALGTSCASSPVWKATPVDSVKTELFAFQGEVFQASDGLSLQGYSWIPAASGEIRGSVVILHGLKDHSRRYQALAEDLIRAGFAVFAQDLRGHGLSAGVTQRVDSFDQLAADADLSVVKAQRAYPGKPIFLLGHSLGGLISTRYALGHPDKLAGLILSAPALKLQDSVGGLTIFLARTASLLTPGALVQKIDEKEFLRTPEAFAEMQADPLVSHQDLPARTAAVSVDAIEDVQKHFGDLQLPFLILHGEGDLVTNREGSRQLFAQSPSTDKKLEFIPLAWHDLMHEPEAPQVRKIILEWVTSRT